MAQQQLDPKQLERTKEEIRQLIRQMQALAEQDLPPGTFFAEYLTRLIKALAAVGGAIWLRTPSGQIQLACELAYLDKADWTQDRSSTGHGAFLAFLLDEGEPSLLRPHAGPEKHALQFPDANPSDFNLVAVPVIVERQRVGVVEVLLQTDRRPQALANAVEFVQRLSTIIGQYIRRMELKELAGQQELWRQLDDFIKHIHSTLDLRETCYHVVNEAKRVLGCDRVSIALMRGRKAAVYAVSGQDTVERKSNLVQQMSRLARAVIKSNDNISFAGLPDENWPPAVRDCVDAFVHESGSKALAVVLLRKPVRRQAGSDEKKQEQGEPIGALIVEKLHDSRGVEQLRQQAEVLAEHASRAVNNALEYEQIFLLPVWRTIGKAREWMRGKKLVKLMVVLTVVVGVTAALVFVPKELRIEGRGEILPEHRQIVFAPEDGIVAEVLIDDGQLVEQGQLILRLDNPELVRQRQDVRRQLLDAQTRLRQLVAMMAAERRRDDQGPGLRTQIEAEIDSLTKQLELFDQRIASLQVRAPLAGMIASWDVRRNLFQRPVKRGDMLVTVADVDERTWELEVRMPEDQMGHVLEAAERHEREQLGPLRASFMLASHPEQVFRGYVKKIAPQAQFDKERQEHVHLVTVALDGVEKVEVERIREGDVVKVREVILTFSDGRQLRMTPGAEVRAKIDCGTTSLGYALFHEVIELVHTILF